MKKQALYSILMLFILAACKNDKEAKIEPKPLSIGALTLSTDQPQPGETIDISYKNDAGDVEAFFAYMVGKSNYPVDIDFTETEGERKSSIKIPDSATALVFLFKSDDKYDDNNEQGYLVPLFSEDGTKLPGSASAIAYYSNYYGSNYGIKADDNALVNAIKADINANPDLKDDWEVPYLQMAYKADKAQTKKLIDEHISALSNKADKTEKDYLSMIELYYASNQESKADSITSIAAQQFPKGRLAKNKTRMAFYQEKDLAKKEQLFSDYAKANTKKDEVYDYMANNLAMTYFNKGDMANFETYSSMVKDKSSRASMLNNIAWSLAEKGKKLDQAEKMSKTSLDIVNTMKENPTDKPDYLTKRQYEKSLESSWNMYADTYALVTFKQGKVKEAIEYQEKAHDPRARDVEANQRFIEYLMADKQYDKVQTNAEKFMELGHANEAIKKAFKTAYNNLNPDKKDADQKIAALEETARNNYIAEVKESMLNEAAPQFTLKDTEGNDVSLASLKGKAVILDFWATWCGPCKASFPGMQKVVTKYKDDDSVKLLFIDTFERGKDREKTVTDFIKTNKYDFHVVYDTDDSETADKFDVEGIPTKIVVGPDGNIKFKSVGYNGSVEKLMEEMDLMIELAKS